jgi:hypothetical protein
MKLEVVGGVCDKKNYNFKDLLEKNCKLSKDCNIN